MCDEESGGNTKWSRTSEEGDYYVETNQELPNVGGSKFQRPMGKDAAKRKGKGKASQSSLAPDYSEEFRSLNITRNSDIEIVATQILKSTI